MRTLLLCLLLSIGTISFSQGLNNDYPFDQKDTENIISFFMDIETYKFDVNAKQSSDLDIVIEVFEKGENVKKSGIVSQMVKDYGMNPINKKFGDEFVRIYVQNDTQDNNLVKIAFKYINLSVSRKFDELDLRNVQSRAFELDGSLIEAKSPVLAVYGNIEGDMISCPGDAVPDDIVKLYDWVTIIYLDKLKS